MIYPAAEQGGLFPKFTDGELAVGPANMENAPALSQFFFARRISLMPGMYRVRITVDDAATLWVGTGRDSMRMVQAFRLDEQTSAWEYRFELYEGESRFDIYLNNLTPEPSLCAFIMSIDRDGAVVYRSSAASWRYDDTAPMADSQLLGGTDISREYPVFSVLPNWKGGVLERIEFLTDVISSEDAREQRRALRQAPRRTIEAGFLRSLAHRARLNNILTGVGTKKMYVPLWFEQHHILRPITPAVNGYVFPRETLVMREFRPGDSVLIMAKDPDSFEVLRIDEVDFDNDLITWSIPPTRTWPLGSRIIPLRLGRVVEAMTMDNRTDSVAEMQIRFEIAEDDQGFPASWGSCSPLFKLDANWSDNVNVTFDRTVFTLDNGVALPVYTDPSDQALLGQRTSIILRRRETVVEFRRFIAMARGRAVRFYAPTNTNDVILSENIPSNRTYFDAKPAAFWESMKTRQFARQMIGIYFGDGAAPIYRYVESVEPVALQGPPYTMAVERYHLDAPLPPIAQNRVTRISWVQAMRFDQDAFEMQHEVDESRVVRTTLVTRIVDPVGMPPIDCWVTSRPYPVDVLDSMAPTMVLTGGRMYDPNLILPPESIAPLMRLTGGTLRELLRDYLMEPEAFQINTGVITEGTLRSVLSAYDMGVEAFQINTGVITEGTLKNALITYDRYPVEAIDISGTITGGTLT